MEQSKISYAICDTHFNIVLFTHVSVWGTLMVAQLFEALRYKPEGRGFFGIFY
jgi:hypothetical protein